MADDIIKIEDHADQAEARLAGKFKNKPRIAGLVRSLADQVQDIEDTLISFLDARRIQTAVGTQLDDLGDLVGVERQDFNDDFYRVLIYIQIAENFAEGQPGPIIIAFKLLTQASSVQYVNNGNASISFISNGFLTGIPSSFVREQLQRLVAAGVRIDTLTIADEEEPFALAGPNPGLGLSDLDQLVGGKLSGNI